MATTAIGHEIETPQTAPNPPATQNAEEKSERIAWIDIVRGLSILGVLFFTSGRRA